MISQSIPNPIHHSTTAPKCPKSTRKTTVDRRQMSPIDLETTQKSGILLKLQWHDSVAGIRPDHLNLILKLNKECHSLRLFLNVHGWLCITWPTDFLLRNGVTYEAARFVVRGRTEVNWVSFSCSAMISCRSCMYGWWQRPKKGKWRMMSLSDTTLSEDLVLLSCDGMGYQSNEADQSC